MISRLIEILKGKKILLLGFGKEGVASYNLLIQYLEPSNIFIADRDSDYISELSFDIHPDCKVFCGENYLEGINDVDLIVKSPGISQKVFKGIHLKSELTSQTDLFLRVFSEQIIGVTGTKGKSTTSSLIAEILSRHFEDVLLVGNIGVPPFEIVNKISTDTKIVFELSSHQLENVTCSPHIAVLLNIYEEHLDHYDNLSAYQKAKFNIVFFQKEKDWFIVNVEDTAIHDLLSKTLIQSKSLSFSLSELKKDGAFLCESGNVIFKNNESVVELNFLNRKYLPGQHNLLNIMAAVCVAKILHVPDKLIESTINSFKGLPHRLEYVGVFKGIHFYNDSIATIPEATIHAVKTLKNVDTLILGGVDRGIDYQSLIDFLPGSRIRNLIFYGKAGERILKRLNRTENSINQKIFVIQYFVELSEIICKHTLTDHVCLLSPAAASYDLFKNFEERGDVFKKMAENL